MSSRGPAIGYDHSVKRQYRRRVWSTLMRTTTPGPLGPSRAECHALILPSLEGDQIEVALAHGFAQDHLHVVDRNPAVVATLKRRYPHIQTYGVRASDAVRRIKKAGVLLDCANFDFTACLGDAFAREWNLIALHSKWRAPYAIALTLQKGREHPPWSQEIEAVADGLPEALDARLAIAAALWQWTRQGSRVHWFYTSQYRIARVPMVYGVFAGGPPACLAHLPPRLTLSAPPALVDGLQRYQMRMTVLATR